MTLSGWVRSEFERYREARSPLEDSWLQAWASYISTEEAYNWLQRSAFRSIKGHAKDWKHRINTGKAFEIVEQQWAYFMQASFPSTNWFDVIPTSLEDDETARVIKQFLRHFLDCDNFQVYYGDYLRQLLIAGSSVMHIAVCPKRKRPKFTVVDNFDIYLDPISTPEDANLIRYYGIARNKLKRIAKSGKFNKLTPKMVDKLSSFNAREEGESAKQDVSTFTQVNDNGVNTNQDIIKMLEFWGDMYDEEGEFLGSGTCTIAGDEVVHMVVTQDPRPYVVGKFLGILNRAWGMSTLTPNQGILHAERAFLNLRLDNLSASINQAFMVMEEHMVDDVTEFKLYPGAVIPVRDPSAVIPLQLGTSQLSLSYQEEYALNARIDRNIGMVPGVGAGPQRKAERVTAQEINAAQESGGTRLNQYHMNIERTSLNPMLNTYYAAWKKVKGFTKLTLKNINYEVGYDLDIQPSQLCCKDVNFKVRGAEAVQTSNSKLSKLVEFLTLAASNPLLQGKVNVDYILEQLVSLWGFDEPEKVLMVEQPEDPMAQQQAATPQQNAVDQLSQINQPAANMVQSQMVADGGVDMATQLSQAYSLGVNK